MLAAPKKLADIGDCIHDCRRVGIQVFVDRGADDDDDVLGVRHDVRNVGSTESPGCEHISQQLICSGFVERHPARIHLGDDGRVDVVRNDIEPFAGKHDGQRQSDVSAASDYDD
jgi:hypothetical protein